MGESWLTDEISHEGRSRISDVLNSLIQNTAAENACIIVATVAEQEDAASLQGKILFWQMNDTASLPVACVLEQTGASPCLPVSFKDKTTKAFFSLAVQVVKHDDIALFVAGYFPHQKASDYDMAFLELSGERVGLIAESASLHREGSLKLLHDRLSLFDEVSEMSSTGGWDYDVQTQQIHWTNETYRLFDFARDTRVTLYRILSCFPSEARRKLIKAIQMLLASGVSYQFELPVITRKKHKRWVKLSGKARKQNGEIVKIFGSVQDITEHKRLSETEQNYIEYLNTILDSMNDAVLTVDELGTIITANQTVEILFGYEPEQVIGEDISYLLPGPPDDEQIEFVRQHLRPGLGAIFGKELSAKHRQGKTFPIEVSVSEVEQVSQSQFVCVIRDITERKQAVDSIYQIAFFDEVTHLPNIKSFEKDLRRLIIAAKTTKRQMYCCMLDIDNFAQFNLSFGKETGDYILRIFAGRIKKAISSRFQVYSGLGDKFYILFKEPFDESKDAATMDLIDSIEWGVHSELGKEFTLHGHSQLVSTSLASTYVHAQDASYEKITGILDFGTRQAKKQGPGGRVTLERNEFNAYDRHNYISQSFAHALEYNEFYLVLQPQYDKHGRILSSEALLRWNEKRLGFISPGEFIPIAEESDAVVDIGYWVINEACRLLSEMKSQGLETTLSVNISGRHIARADFSDRLLETISEWQINPEQLVLEITETTLVTTIDLVRKRIERLSQLGFAFSIDDFGTGYSSLSYLKELPITELKIDRYFVDEINFESDDVPIVNTIIEMASAMGVRTVAEGIENEIQIQYLTRRGCDIFQGFYLSKPVEEETWRNLLLTCAKGKIARLVN